MAKFPAEMRGSNMPSDIVIFLVGIRYITSNIIICPAKIRGSYMPSNVVIFSVHMWRVLICHSNKLVIPGKMRRLSNVVIF